MLVGAGPLFFSFSFVVAGLQTGSVDRFCGGMAKMSAARPQLFFSHVLQGKELGETRFACVGTAGVIDGLE